MKRAFGPKGFDHSSSKVFQCCAFVHGDVVCFVALDLVLRVVGGGVMGVALVVRVSGVDFDDVAGDVACFGVPGYVVADFEFLCHWVCTAFIEQPDRRFFDCANRKKRGSLRSE